MSTYHLTVEAAIQQDTCSFCNFCHQTHLLSRPRPGGIKRWCCLTSVCLSVAYIRSAGGVCGRPAGRRILAYRDRLGRPGIRLLLCASIAGLGGSISWWPPAYNLFVYTLTMQKPCRFCVKPAGMDSDAAGLPWGLK